MTGRRVHERYHCDLTVTVLFEEREIPTRTDNISLGGMYLLTDEKVAYGSEVKLRFRLPSMKEDTICPAVVRWNKPEGIGVQFGSLRALDVWALNQYFKTLEKLPPAP